MALAFIVAGCVSESSNAPPPAQPPPVPTVDPTLSISNAVVTEGDTGTTTLQFTVQAGGVFPVPSILADATVSYTTSSGTATG